MTKDRTATRQIVGISLSPDSARTFKAEAARRGMSLKELFEEMWELYAKSQKAKKP
ncbi:MAG: ribbon-helix-helix protein, CopG family [Hyphomicrobiaceae bacterium]